MRTHRFWQKALVGAMVCGIILGQTIEVAGAASTDISNVPMAVENTVPPNIMYTLDNSGSMTWTFMPDSVASNSPWNLPNQACYRNSSYNQIYYNPNITYAPPVKSDGTPYPNQSFTAALYDGFNSSSGTVDLSQAFQADMYVPYSANNYYYSSYWGGLRDTAQTAYYYNYSGSGTPTVGTCYSNANYTKITVSSTSGPGGTDERQNFANWFSYYRARILTMKTAIGTGFSALNANKFRVGFSTINNNSGGVNNSGANFINIDLFNNNKANWYSMLYSIAPSGSTPLQESLRKDGEYYRTGSMPGASSSTDPVQYSCQQNYAIVSTDGFWNGTPPNIGDWDKTIPNPLPDPVDGLTAGSQWPVAIWEGSTATSNTMADMAMKYWVTDLRPTMTDNVAPNPDDPAIWQHMDTFTIGLADGTLAYPGGLPTTSSPNWPVPSADQPTTIDDLWHAAVNGHGEYLNAKNPAAITNGLTNVLDTIIGRTGAAAAVAVSNANVVPGDNYSYASSYNSGTWTGDLNAYTIDTTTGQPSTAPSWSSSAQAQLDTLGWTTRKIATYSGSAGIPFAWTSLTSGEQSALNTPYSPPGTADGAAVLNFLRGDRSQENAGIYRARAHILGDIINAEPVIVREPTAGYADAGYSAFKTSYATRTKMIYQGANDGMLHAFTAATGAEAWDYIPGILLNNERLASPYASTSVLVNLSRKTGFMHLYYVDGTPAAGDVDFQNTKGATGSGTDWHTILVGGLRKGGHGFYALDVTNPAAATDSDVAGKVLWEFPNSGTNATVAKNVGYSFAKPIIVKTKATGWVVLVTSGYNNGADTGGDGQGHLFVLNAKTGALIKDLSTGVGSSTTPSGLAQISAYVDNGNVDNTTDIVYGGDLQGNVWRFDLSANNANQWGVTKLATLVDGSNNPQPITTAPELGSVNSKRMIYVGTGQYLGDSDIPGTNANASATQTQTMYGLYDDMSGATLTNLRGSNGSACPTGGGDGVLVCQGLTTDTSATPPTRSISPTNTVNLNTKKGWYVDLPDTGERVVTDPALALGTLIFTSNVPSNTDPCEPGGSSWLYMLDYSTGGYIPGSTVSWSATSLGPTLASRPILIQLPSGAVEVLVRKSDATTATTQVPLPPTPSTGKRVSWREIITR